MNMDEYVKKASALFNQSIYIMGLVIFAFICTIYVVILGTNDYFLFLIIFIDFFSMYILITTVVLLKKYRKKIEELEQRLMKEKTK